MITILAVFVFTMTPRLLVAMDDSGMAGHVLQ